MGVVCSKPVLVNFFIYLDAALCVRPFNLDVFVWDPGDRLAEPRNSAETRPFALICASSDLCYRFAG